MPTHERVSGKHPAKIYRFDRFSESAINFDAQTIDTAMQGEESFHVVSFS
jgi:hypothetical protein